MARTLTRGGVMGVAWRYWRWVKIDPGQGRAVVPLAPARDFFHQQLGYYADDERVDDKTSQRHLKKHLEQEPETLVGRLSEACLRCFISTQIDWICNDLAQKFGSVGEFDHHDLLSLVLDDVGVAELVILTPFAKRTPSTRALHQANKGEPENSSTVPVRHIPLAVQILQSFDPEKAQLSTWCRQMVVSQGEFSKFLKERGITLESDWSILNNTSSDQLRRILQRFNKFPSPKIEQAVHLLESYHAIYRHDRLQKLQEKGTRGRCRPPGSDQLMRMLDYLQKRGISSPSSAQLLEQLQAIAQIIRESRRPQTIPLDDGHISSIIQPETEAEEHIFLKEYRKVFEETLTEAIAQVVEAQAARYKRRKQPCDREYLLGLKLFHCKGQSMSEIAPQVNLEHQFQVSRLLKLKDLRDDVRRTMLAKLGQRISILALDYNDSVQLHKVDKELDIAMNAPVAPALQEALEADVDKMISAAEKEAATAHYFLKTSFSHVLCRYLDTKE
ncbi:hypothetical protein [Leptolyngbya sp. FACHB-16]|uniref:hypothetical protein n=1 Tax=unclassified Leptolyngbya TaxID=2650499 RepID=UPI001688F81E|nr:hypothetical protein [Leptolyngbya sp. FACHB-16]MBD2158407.1 hypothetical protein [Leptolyngbya sp. FACHB-16]